MTLTGRILRYFLEGLAVGCVLLIPAGCDPTASTLPSQIADDGTSNDESAGEGDSFGDPAQPEGDPAQPGVAETPGDDDASPNNPQEEQPSADEPDDGLASDDGDDPPPADAGDNDPPPDDSGDNDPPSDDGEDDDPPPDDDADDDPPPDDGGDDSPPDDGGEDDPPADDGGDDPPADPEVPSNAYCDPVANWSDAWRVYEEDVLILVNERRAAGATCGSYGTFVSAGPLMFDPALRCAARAHSMDMGERDFFSHTNPDGDGPGQRLAYAGYSGFGWGENIAWGYSSPSAVVAAWMTSPGHCANIMRPQWTLIGVGYYEGNIWTQTFGAN